MSYLKEAFEPVSLEHAKNIALTGDLARPNKFKEETDYLVNVITLQTPVTPQSLVLDFGCGMGRVAKRLIEAAGCRVVGTDTSSSMLRFAREYVGSDLFEARTSFEAPSAADLAIAAFVLQHAENPAQAIDSIYSALKPGATLALLDDGKRFVPSGVDAQGYVIWQDDGVVVEAFIKEKFSLLNRFPYPNRHDLPLSLWKKI